MRYLIYLKNNSNKHFPMQNNFPHKKLLVRVKLFSTLNLFKGLG